MTTVVDEVRIDFNPSGTSKEEQFQTSRSTNVERIFCWSEGTWSWIDDVVSKPNGDGVASAYDGKYYAEFPVRRNSDYRLGHGQIGIEPINAVLPISFGYTHNKVPWSTYFGTWRAVQVSSKASANFGRVTILKSSDQFGTTLYAELLTEGGFFPIKVEKVAQRGTSVDTETWLVDEVQDVSGIPFPKTARYQREMALGERLIHSLRINLVIKDVRLGSDAFAPNLTFPPGLKLYDTTDRNQYKAIRVGQDGSLEEVDVLDGTIAGAEILAKSQRRLWTGIALAAVIIGAVILAMKLGLLGKQKP